MHVTGIWWTSVTGKHWYPIGLQFGTQVLKHGTLVLKHGTLSFQNGEFSNPNCFVIHFLRGKKIKYNELKSKKSGVLA